MQRFVISQVIEANSQAEAVIVAARRFGWPDDTGFDYALGNQTIRPQFPTIESSIIDSIIKKAVAGVAMYYISKSLKNWSKG